ncbi:MAG: NAD(P)/FAD-dependent oxidoreductase [candidate division Zixibacteria bacterium]|nr:NAD(P)/FAD-dependent oxidoreductase [candidate division Zixibacteria bacterium]
MTDDSDLYDITIVGGGPVGLFAAFYAGLRDMKTKIIDSLPELGGQLVTLYPEKMVYDVPGFPQELGRDLASGFIEQGTRFHPTICLNENVIHLQRTPEGLPVLVTQKGEHCSRSVLLATGVGAFRPVKTGIPDVDDLEGHGVYYLVKSLAEFAGKRLVILGGGDSAVDWALNLYGKAKSIVLVHRREQFRAHEKSVEEMHRLKTDVRIPYEAKGAFADAAGHIREIEIVHKETGQVVFLECDALLVNFGFKADTKFLRDWGLEMAGGKVTVDAYMRTSLPAVYAAGDAATYDGSLNLIVTGVADATIAVNHAKTLVDPRAKLDPGHSSAREDLAQPAPGKSA